MNKIGRLRKKIDAIDRKMLALLSERGKVAQGIGKMKREKGAGVLVPSREQSIYDRLSRFNKGPYRREAVLSIFREIISATRALEAPLRISYLGPEATFTHMAAVRHFGSSAEFVPEAGIENIFAAVTRGESDFGVVPIENSTEGVVSHTLDLFVDSDLSISSEEVLKIAHHLLSREEGIGRIDRVYSHPHAIAQCRNWLMTHLPNVPVKEMESTAAAAKRAAGERHSAAIASEFASSRYGLPVRAREIQDQPQNFTRFLIIGRQPPRRTGRDKTSILFMTRDEVGILHQILGSFARQKINLTKIESRPLKKRAWEYMFFADLDGHLSERRIARALSEVQKKCTFFKILGSYPKSRI
ncbi:MAG: prephenate dehydratase [Deltaproteobacteria bacterium]|nr:prephenate dehydratase [Deltaproteobacteria bacterium]